MTTPPYRAIRMLQSGPAELAHGWSELLKPPPPAAGAVFTHTCGGNVWERLRACTFTLATSAAAGQRQPLLNYLDTDGFIYDQLIAGANPGGLTTVTTFLNDHTPTAAAPGQSTSGTGVVTGPGAGGVIASVSLPAGTYTVNWRVAVGGTTAAAEQDNFQLVVGATVVAVSENGSSSGTDVAQNAVGIDVPTGGATVAIQAVGAGTGTATYRATLTAAPTAGLTYYGQLPELLLRPGYAVQIAVTGIQAADQLSGIGMFFQRYPSDWAGGSTYQDELAAELAELDRLRRGG